MHTRRGDRGRAEGRISPKDLGLWNDEQRDALAPIVRFMRAQGAVAGTQLAHAGRKAGAWPEWGTGRTDGSIPLDEGGWETVAPSAVAFPGLRVPRELDQPGIDGIVGAFAAAARRAVDAGFELLEVHGAHGYPVHEFLSPLSNQRTDGYGGPLENRARLLLDIVDAIRHEVGESVVLAVRLSATDRVEGGVTSDETVQVASWLGEHGVDLVDVSTGGNAPATIPAGPGYQVPFATAIRAGSKLPAGAVGLITEARQAEHILLTEQADVVLVGREMLRDPNFPIHAARAAGFPTPPVPAPYRRGFR
ncbi:oxidoreductase [Paractinoplanes abujensis]|uniref:2,4-dienoyl-CoA reductase-like NADH-dependent reductase (Old Yellow Enzyme family) n=1 Tax=Paractinoplanes abujensis TaxID=882441 RepID=A0A7W7CW04_9ACTN|nr:oxidoreductase [Actinoplanes abujensis]MBB4694026.1 2,4-dienoyl-CoA reductase-like NADH-dependent reductase (Old Yellow Enzyme family) [Actinoplanes abujensis]GID21316.1 oxidoreductase [Actinoplanes abujensis]